MGGRDALCVLLVLAGCRQLFGFNDPKPLTADAPAHPDGPPCLATGLNCSGTKTAMDCNGCIVSCSDQVDQITAKNRCVAWGGALLVIDSDTAQCLSSAIPPAQTWIGLEQMTGATTPIAGWSWGGTGGQLFFSNWAASEPDDDNSGAEIGKAQCARVSNGNTWDDTVCTQPNAFACSRGGGGN